MIEDGTNTEIETGGSPEPESAPNAENPSAGSTPPTNQPLSPELTDGDDNEQGVPNKHTAFSHARVVEQNITGGYGPLTLGENIRQNITSGSIHGNIYINNNEKADFFKVDPTEPFEATKLSSLSMDAAILEKKLEQVLRSRVMTIYSPDEEIAKGLLDKLARLFANRGEDHGVRQLYFEQKSAQYRLNHFLDGFHNKKIGCHEHTLLVAFERQFFHFEEYQSPSFFDSLYQSSNSIENQLTKLRLYNATIIYVAYSQELIEESLKRKSDWYFEEPWYIPALEILVGQYFPKDQVSAICRTLREQQERGAWPSVNENQKFIRSVRECLRKECLEKVLEEKVAAIQSGAFKKDSSQENFQPIQLIRSRLINKYVLFAGTYLPNLTPLEFSQMIEMLRKDQGSNASETAKQPAEEFEDQLDDMLMECRLNVETDAYNRLCIRFEEWSFRQASKDYFEKQGALFMSRQVQKLLYSELLFDPKSSEALLKNISYLFRWFALTDPDRFLVQPLSPIIERLMAQDERLSEKKQKINRLYKVIGEIDRTIRQIELKEAMALLAVLQQLAHVTQEEQQVLLAHDKLHAWVNQLSVTKNGETVKIDRREAVEYLGQLRKEYVELRREWLKEYNDLLKDRNLWLDHLTQWVIQVQKADALKGALEKWMQGLEEKVGQNEILLEILERLLLQQDTPVLSWFKRMLRSRVRKTRNMAQYYLFRLVEKSASRQFEILEEIRSWEQDEDIIDPEQNRLNRFIRAFVFQWFSFEEEHKSISSKEGYYVLRSSIVEEKQFGAWPPAYKLFAGWDMCTTISQETNYLDELIKWLFHPNLGKAIYGLTKENDPNSDLDPKGIKEYVAFRQAGFIENRIASLWSYDFEQCPEESRKLGEAFIRAVFQHASLWEQAQLTKHFGRKARFFSRMIAREKKRKSEFGRRETEAFKKKREFVRYVNECFQQHRSNRETHPQIRFKS